MNKRDGYFSKALRKRAVVVLGAPVLIASATALPAIADAESSFNGTYTAVQKSFSIDARTGARVPQPDQVGIWIVSSSCTMLGCVARAVRIGDGIDLVFDGHQWNQLAVPHTGTCAAATVPALAAALYLVPQSDGSLSGAVTSTVDCAGATINSSQPLTLTPS